MTPLKSIHQIELSGLCNLKCPYCPHGQPGTFKRKQAFMSKQTWRQALAWVEHFVAAGTQSSLNLAGTGESTLHPDFVEMVAEARAVLGPERHIDLATNGVALKEEAIKALAPFNPRVWVSLHEPVRAAAAVRWLKEAGIFAGPSCDGVINPNDWAGQVKWEKASYRFACPWLHEGHGFVACTGEILTCCLDLDYRSMVAHVAEAPSPRTMGRWALCDTCYQEPALTALP